MKITFIAHSAFLVEWDKFYTLFDYVYEPDYTGTLPPLDPLRRRLLDRHHQIERRQRKPLTKPAPPTTTQSAKP